MVSYSTLSSGKVFHSSRAHGSLRNISRMRPIRSCSGRTKRKNCNASIKSIPEKKPQKSLLMVPSTSKKMLNRSLFKIKRGKQWKGKLNKIFLNFNKILLISALQKMEAKNLATRRPLPIEGKALKKRKPNQKTQSSRFCSRLRNSRRKNPIWLKTKRKTRLGSRCNFP